jgi:hypothetical protein
MPAQPQGQRSSAETEAGQQGSPGTKDRAVCQRLQFPKVLVNHIGFRPDAGKYLVVDGVKGAKKFEIVNMHQKGSKPSYVGKLARTGNDLGEYLIGDFSDLREPGIYRASVMGNYTFGYLELSSLVAQLCYRRYSLGRSHRQTRKLLSRRELRSKQTWLQHPLSHGQDPTG